MIFLILNLSLDFQFFSSKFCRKLITETNKKTKQKGFSFFKHEQTKNRYFEYEHFFLLAFLLLGQLSGKIIKVV